MNASRNSIREIWGERTPYYDQWPERVDQYITEEPDKWVQSACVLCSNGCGIDIGVKDNRIVGVRGRAVDRINHGRLGPKGLHGWKANHSNDRLTVPLIKENGSFRKATWQEAMDLIVTRSKELIARHTSGSLAFYNSGQLFLEEYYTLSVITKAGLGTNHVDGNTRLCTSTSAWALKLSFGADGQPASYRDIDLTDALLLVGHNMAFTQTVLWSRVLDRMKGPRPPKLIVVDPRRTATAEMADVHLMPRVGTNVPLLNGLLHQLIEWDAVDHDYLEKHTVGFDALKSTVSQWTPELVEKVTGVPASLLLKAASIIASTPSLVSTALQGVFQAWQATGAAVQINNLHLIRGLLGKEGSGVFQMNGQPTAQNTRECGANGELPAFFNWHNEKHVRQLADIWNVDPSIIPHWGPPTPIMEIMRYAELGSVKMLWIAGTNPAVSLPGLSRIRHILKKNDLFVVVQDAFMTETAQLADVVLPTALWGEKTGCFTNADRTVHISHKAIDPPGEAKSDLDIFIDYARRMDLRDKDGQPLVKWSSPEEAFEGWKRCSKGRPCDYSGLSYEKLSQGSGIQWPCNEQYPDGKERLYTDGYFNTDYELCEGYTHDLTTGGAVPPEKYKENNPAGRAIILPCEYDPPLGFTDESYPLLLTTGRVVYHFHTRTKTGRVKELNDAAPDVFIQISQEDANEHNIQEGDLVRLESRFGSVQGPARIGGIAPGLVFVPFHYGYWDGEDAKTAANELTKPSWDPVSKQPHFKYNAVNLVRLDTKLSELASKTKDTLRSAVKSAVQTTKETLKL
ncbi:nitrate reductase [Fulvivirgaceae bacterium PWU4]|uniref:Nitrate reductase n=1 Tax=Chryseosolibacter histidini TaxID=2782349 RepID=A0AAP2DFS3_9BACT|nr:nitrate reductase [Chryseosolibacter histidini]